MSAHVLTEVSCHLIFGIRQLISAQKCYFEPCLLQVLSTFYVLINVINPIFTLRSPVILLIAFFGKFCSFCELIVPKLLSRSKHEEFESNSTLQTRDQKERRAENERKLELLRNYILHELFTALSTVHVSCIHCSPILMLSCFCSNYYFLPILSLIIPYELGCFCNFPLF